MNLPHDLVLVAVEILNYRPLNELLEARDFEGIARLNGLHDQLDHGVAEYVMNSQDVRIDPGESFESAVARARSEINTAAGALWRSGEMALAV